MTPADLPPDPPADAGDGPGPEPTDDELAVHAVLDGEATAAQRRRVAGDPGLRAQVTEMKLVVDQVAAPPQAPGEDVFEAIRAAAASHLGDPEEILDLRDGAEPAPPPPEVEPGPAPGAPDDRTDADATVVPLDRPRRQNRRRWPALPAVAAAVLVLVALGVGLIVTAGDDDPQADFTAVGDAIEPHDDAGGGSSEESAEDGADQESEGAADGETAPTTTAGPAASGDQGTGASDGLAPQASFPDDAALREVLQEVDPATLVLDPGPTGFESDQLAGNLRRAGTTEVARCSTVLQSSDPAIGPAQAAIVVDLAGETVHVLSSPLAASDDGDAGTLLHVIDPVSCVPRFAVQR